MGNSLKSPLKIYILYGEKFYAHSHNADARPALRARLD
jgi:hypothetical protein